MARNNPVVKQLTVEVPIEVDWTVDTGPRGDYLPIFNLKGTDTLVFVSFDEGSGQWELHRPGRSAIRFHAAYSGQAGNVDRALKATIEQATRILIEELLADAQLDALRRA